MSLIENLSEESAALTIKPDRYFEVIAFLGNEKHDWLGTVWRDKDGPWTMTWRFRYYRDTRAFESQDEKQFYIARSPKSLSSDEISKALIDMIKTLMACGFADGPADVLMVRTDDPKRIIEELAKHPWTHVRELTGPNVPQA